MKIQPSIQVNPFQFIAQSSSCPRPRDVPAAEVHQPAPHTTEEVILSSAASTPALTAAQKNVDAPAPTKTAAPGYSNAPLLLEDPSFSPESTTAQPSLGAMFRLNEDMHRETFAQLLSRTSPTLQTQLMAQETHRSVAQRQIEEILADPAMMQSRRKASAAYAQVALEYIIR